MKNSFIILGAICILCAVLIALKYFDYRVVFLFIAFIYFAYKFVTKYIEHKKYYDKLTDSDFLKVYDGIVNNSTIPYIRMKFPIFKLLMVIIANVILISVLIKISFTPEMFFIVMLDLIALFFEIGYVYKGYKKRELDYNSKNGNKYKIYTVEQMAKCMGNNFYKLSNNNYSISSMLGIKVHNVFPYEEFYRVNAEVGFKYFISDNVFGNIYNLKFISRDSKGKEFVKFFGSFCEIPLDFKFEDEIEITVNNIFNIDKVDMDNENFEKYFDVVGTNKMQIMQVFTSDFMIEVLDLYKKFMVPFKLKVKNNSIYILFYKNIFTFSVYFGRINKIKVYKDYSVLKKIIELGNMFYNKLKETL